MPDPGTENVTVLLSSMLGGSSMRVCFLEDTDLHGGTQIWVVEAARNFLKAGTEVTVLTSESGWVAEQCAKTNARLVTYNYHEVVGRDDAHRDL